MKNTTTENMAAALRDACAIFARVGLRDDEMASMRAALAAYDAEPPAEPVSVAIFVSGGCVTDVATSAPGIVYHLIDADNIDDRADEPGDDEADDDREDSEQVWERVTAGFFAAQEATL